MIHFAGLKAVGESVAIPWKYYDNNLNSTLVLTKVMEEVGIEVEDVQYFGSQSWPFPNSLMLAFRAEYESGDIKVDGDEIVKAKWFKKYNYKS